MGHACALPMSVNFEGVLLGTLKEDRLEARNDQITLVPSGSVRKGKKYSLKPCSPVD